MFLAKNEGTDGKKGYTLNTRRKKEHLYKLWTEKEPSSIARFTRHTLTVYPFLSKTHGCILFVPYIYPFLPNPIAEYLIWPKAWMYTLFWPSP